MIYLYLTQTDNELEEYLSSNNISFKQYANNDLIDSDKIICHTRLQVQEMLNKGVHMDNLLLKPTKLEYMIENIQQQPVLVSACLTGQNCRYDGQSKSQAIHSPFKEFRIIPFCPEIVALPTPRPPACIYVVEGKRVVLQVQSRVDVTQQYEEGAFETLKKCNEIGIWYGVMKKRSPSCGVKYTNLNDTVQEGSGVTSQLLQENGCILIDSDN